jgi:hypothetical protein
LFTSITMSGLQVLCAKNGVTLGITEGSDDVKFYISFSLDNENADIKSMIGFKLFELMGAINPDVIDSARVIIPDNQDGKTLLILKPFGKELGLARKYVYSSTSMRWSDDNSSVKIISCQQQLPSDVDVPIGSEPAELANSVMHAHFSDSHHAVVKYVFTMILDNSMPKYMRKMPGNLMHIVFSRVKEFIEKVGSDCKR